MEPKIYYEEDKNGKHKVLDYSKYDENNKLIGNKKTVRILQEPSKWYIDKQKKNQERLAEKKLESKKIAEREKLIKEKMRELAIAELQKEGKII